jgi:hypothetical protein
MRHLTLELGTGRWSEVVDHQPTPNIKGDGKMGLTVQLKSILSDKFTNDRQKPSMKPSVRGIKVDKVN